MPHRANLVFCVCSYYSVWVLPAMQMGGLGLTQESDCVRWLLEAAANSGGAKSESKSGPAFEYVSGSISGGARSESQSGAASGSVPRSVSGPETDETDETGETASGNMVSPDRRLAPPGQRGRSPQRHTAGSEGGGGDGGGGEGGGGDGGGGDGGGGAGAGAGAGTAAPTTLDKGNTAPQRAGTWPWAQSRLLLSSPYLNLPPEYTDALLGRSQTHSQARSQTVSQQHSRETHHTRTPTTQLVDEFTLGLPTERATEEPQPVPVHSRSQQHSQPCLGHSQPDPNLPPEYIADLLGHSQSPSQHSQMVHNTKGTRAHTQREQFGSTPPLFPPSIPPTLLTASPEANGFYGATGLRGLIPKAYTALELGLRGRATSLSPEATQPQNRSLISRAYTALELALRGRAIPVSPEATRADDDMSTTERHLPTPRRGNSPQQHTAAGTAAPTPTDTTNRNLGLTRYTESGCSGSHSHGDDTGGEGRGVSNSRVSRESGCSGSHSHGDDTRGEGRGVSNSRAGCSGSHSHGDDTGGEGRDSRASGEPGRSGSQTVQRSQGTRAYTQNSHGEDTGGEGRDSSNLSRCQRAAALSPGLDVRHYARTGWTFHAKGLWIWPAGAVEQVSV